MFIFGHAASSSLCTDIVSSCSERGLLFSCGARASHRGPTLTSVQDYWKNHGFDYMDLCWQSDVSDFKYATYVIAFCPRSKSLLILWLQSLSMVILEPKKIKSVTDSIFPHLFAMK